MKTGLAILFLLFISSSAIAQSSGFAMLDIAPTPFSLSKAEATTSIPDGSASIYSNPALLIYNKSSSIDLSYTLWIAGVNNIFGGINFINERRAIAFSFYSSGADDYQQYDRPGQSNGNFSIQYLSISAAYAYDFNYFSLGGAIQYLNEEVFTYQANGYAFNFGIATQVFDERIKAGASLTNVGEMDQLNINSTSLPSNLKFGLSADIAELTAPKNDNLPILISAFADFIHPLEDTSGKDFAGYISSENYFNLGLALTIAEVLELSGGYKTQNNVRPIAFGAGFTSNEITFNYALIPFNTGYGTVHSIGIKYQFN
ncbi:MAG TPA: PorV/PorQ family protein [Gracilimonas sp.]|uniref:PorV/PorQ family protein n=1 Tax=Gracilimonas sp. TaxID=1974203 RepID=UPI002DA094BF|nr:PorV/PorQ family protein [Gracilimonas sp.]